MRRALSQQEPLHSPGFSNFSLRSPTQNAGFCSHRNPPSRGLAKRERLSALRGKVKIFPRGKVHDNKDSYKLTGTMCKVTTDDSVIQIPPLSRMAMFWAIPRKTLFCYADCYHLAQQSPEHRLQGRLPSHSSTGSPPPHLVIPGKRSISASMAQHQDQQEPIMWTWTISLVLLKQALPAESVCAFDV